jgi:Holliday junction DNA helicase RuvA
MIHRLRGRLIEKQLTQVVVDTGGVGYGVAVSPQTSGQLPEPGIDGAVEVDLFIHTHVYEGGIDLYGFQNAEDREVFQRLTGVSKVGHKMAMNILAGLEADELVRVIAEGDLARLVRIPGIGKKTAERMVLELKEPFGELRRLRQAASPAAAAADAAGTPAAQTVAATLEDVRSALLNFGYKPGTVNRVVPLLQKSAEEGEQLADLIREGLRLLQQG